MNNQLSKIRILSGDNSPTTKVNALMSKLNFVEKQIHEGAVQRENEDLVNKWNGLKSTLDLVETTVETLQQKIDELTNTLTDNRQILLSDVTKKIKSVKPAEYRNLKEKTTFIESDVDRLKTQVSVNVSGIIRAKAVADNGFNLIKEIKTYQKLQLKSHYTGNLNFINFGDWGVLDGNIKINDDEEFISTYVVCDIPWSFKYEGYALSNKTPITFKIENSELFITQLRTIRQDILFKLNIFRPL